MLEHQNLTKFHAVHTGLQRTCNHGPCMNSTSVTYHLSKSALMATQGVGTGVSAGDAVSESDMVYGVGVYACLLCALLWLHVQKKKREWRVRVGKREGECT